MKKVISINGMHCDHCKLTVEKALGEVNGVTNVKVNLDKKTATITCAQDIDNATLTAQIKDAGFEVVDINVKKGLW